MARPPVVIDMPQLEALMQFRPTLAEAAAFFQTSEDTIERRIKEQFDVTYAEFREQRMIHTKLALIKRALERSEKSDRMLIHCLAHLCGWVGAGNIAIVNNNSQGEGTQTTVVASDEKLIELIKVARGQT